MQAVFANAHKKTELCRCYPSRSPQHLTLLQELIFHPHASIICPKSCYATPQKGSIFSHWHPPATHPPTNTLLSFFFLFKVGIHHLSFWCQIVCSGFCFHSSSEIQSCFILFCSRFSKVVWCLFQKPHF